MLDTVEVPRRLALMRSWIGQKEVPGTLANPVIAGTPTSWFSILGWPTIKSDEVANCAAAAGASLVLETFADSGFTLDDCKSKDPALAQAALKALTEALERTPLPPHKDRLLARSFASLGVDASHDPKPGDFLIIPRPPVEWQGHIMMIDEVQSSLRRYKCIGANQNDETSYANIGFDADIVAIRRPIAATVANLRAAGSNAIKRGDTLVAAGDALSVGVPTVTVAGKVIEKLSEVPPLPEPATALEQLQRGTEHLDAFNKLSDAVIAAGMLFVNHPWLVGVIAAGILLRVYGIAECIARVRSFAAGVPLSNQEQPA